MWQSQDLQLKFWLQRLFHQSRDHTTSHDGHLLYCKLVYALIFICNYFICLYISYLLMYNNKLPLITAA